MKKAKVLIPAIAALVLSSAAAVTGTVAWFTANLKASANTENITVVKTGSKLSVELASGTGATVGDHDKNPSTPDSVKHGSFVDGSVDLTTGNVYGPTFGPDGKTITGFAQEQEYGTGQFRATSFTMTFTLDMSLEQDNTTFGIYLDVPAMIADLGAGVTGNVTEGFRVGIKTTKNYMVWAPYSASKENLEYVGGSTTSEANYAKYDAAHVVDDEPAVTTYVASGNTMLGKVDNTVSSTPTLTATVYTWFEGAVVTNDSVLQNKAISYNIHVNAVKNVA